MKNLCKQNSPRSEFSKEEFCQETTSVNVVEDSRYLEAHVAKTLTLCHCC